MVLDAGIDPETRVEHPEEAKHVDLSAASSGRAKKISNLARWIVLCPWGLEEIDLKFKLNGVPTCRCRGPLILRKLKKPTIELIVIGNLLSALIGIEGRYITINKVYANEDSYSFHLDGSMDLALQESCGLVNHAFAAALRALLLEVELEASTLQSDINCSYETLGHSTSNEILDKAMLSSKPSVSKQPLES
ncbi:hypothetical protein Tco_1202334 [Tanacetum coccineum]